MRLSLRNVRRVLVLALGAALAASIAGATVPSTFSYQGVLTDNGGDLVPNGPYNLTFKLYSVPSGGSAQWTETQNAIPVNKGGFSAVLGAVTPIGISFDQQLYLGIAINGGAELSPRVVLTPAPQALALRLPYMGITNSNETSLSVVNENIGNYAMYVDPAMFLGGLYGDGLMGIGATAAAFGVASIEGGSLGGFFTSWSTITGQVAASLGVEPGWNSGRVQLYKNGVAKVRVGADNTGAGDPYLVMSGTARSITMNTFNSGDASVSLPANAIAAEEVLDEPGIAQGHNGGWVDISTSATVTDLISVQITTPAPGYIVVEGDGMHGLGGDGTSQNEAEFTIKDAAGGSIDFTNYYVSGFYISPNVFLFRTSVSMRRTYFKPAGTYTFYFQARANNPSALYNYIWDPTITASYSPTSYGTVTTIASRSDAARDGLDGRVVSAATGPGGERVPGDAVEVDLRTLELRAAKLREAAAEAEAAAMKARLAKDVQPRKVSAPKKVKP